MEILIDAHGLYNVPAAVRLANKMAAYNIFWFEEPVPPENLAALKKVADAIAPLGIAVATGERQSPS